MLAPPHTEHCHLFGREDVGALLGITTETASRTVSEFKKSRAISEIASNVFIRDVPVLTRISEGT